MTHRTKRIGIAAASVAIAATAVVPMAITFFSAGQIFGRSVADKDTVDMRYADYDATTYPRTTVTFPCGGVTLTGYRFDAAAPKGLVILAHGLNSSADTLLPLATYFYDHGWSVLSFDGTGVAASEGGSIRGLGQRRVDLRAAIDWVRTQDDLAGLPLVLVGHSMGGYAVNAVLADEQGADVRGVVSFAALNSPIETTDAAYASSLGPLAALFVPSVRIYNYVTFGADAATTAVDGINATDAPVMVVYGTGDEYVPPTQTGILGHADEITNPQVEFVEVGEAYRNTHSTLWYSTDSAQYALETWARRDELRQEYGTPLPANVYDELLATVDKSRMGRVDEQLMARVEQFLQDAVS